MSGFLNIKVEHKFIEYLQNHRLGSQARPDFYYVAKRRAKISITIGKHVTPTTDDGAYEILPNADLRLEAGETIHFKDGFHAQAGSKLHAKIYYEDCLGLHLRKGNLNNNQNDESSNAFSNDDEEAKTIKNDKNEIKIYPNPSSTNLTIHSKEKIDQIRIYNIMGNEIYNFQISSDDKRYFINHKFNKGSYLLHLKKENEILIKQFVVL